MNSPQPIKYKDVEDLLVQLPREQLVVLESLRQLVFDTLPRVREKLSYNVPFYYLNRRIAFIWPGHVPWGGIQDGVLLGFTKGYLFQDEKILFPEARHKEIRQLRFTTPEQIPVDLIKALLIEAAALDVNIKPGYTDQ